MRHKTIVDNKHSSWTVLIPSNAFQSVISSFDFPKNYGHSILQGLKHVIVYLDCGSSDSISFKTWSMHSTKYAKARNSE